MPNNLELTVRSIGRRLADLSSTIPESNVGYVRVVQDLETVNTTSLPNTEAFVLVSTGAMYFYSSTSTLPDDGSGDYAVHDADARVFVRSPVEVDYTTYDVFVWGGQSNSVRQADDINTSPTALNAAYYVSTAVYSPMAANIGGTPSNSMAPAFVNEWYNLTGRKALVLDTGLSGAGLLPVTSAPWSAAGSKRAQLVADTAAAKEAAVQAIPGCSIGDTYIIWVQGESESQNINGTDVTAALYEQELINLADYFKANVPGLVTTGVIKTGDVNGRPTQPLSEAVDWADIRQAQENACNTSDNLNMLYRHALGFAYDGQRQMDDGLHYAQEGYNLAGYSAAKALYAGNVSKPTEPGVLHAAAFSDTNPSVNETTRTDSYTTAIGTKVLIVAVSMSLVNGNGTRNVNSVTFDGVALTEFNTTISGPAAGDSVGGGRSDTGLFYLTEDTYGASLSGVTGDITVVSSGAVNMLSSAAFSVDAPLVAESCMDSRFGGSSGPSPNDTFLVPIASSCDGLFIGVTSSTAASTTALAHTFSGVSTTAVADAGGSNGTKSGQHAFFYGNSAEGLDQLTCTLSADAVCGVMQVMGARGKLAEE